MNIPIISIVDDDDVVRTSLDSLVRSMGYISRPYACAEDFLASAAVQTTSFLISDIRMPGLNGFELYEQLVARSIHYPVIFITGCASETAQLKARQLGAVGYLRKPFNSAQLITLVEDVLNVDTAD